MHRAIRIRRQLVPKRIPIVTFSLFWELVKLRAYAALAIVIVTSPQVLSQMHASSLCIVDTKSDRLSQYDPSAGPYAIGMYKQLSGQRLQKKLNQMP